MSIYASSEGTDIIRDLLAARARPLWDSAMPSYTPEAGAQGQAPLLRLAWGVPEPAAFPLQELREACRLVLKQEGDLALQYGGPYGHSGLREALAGRIGTQEGMELSVDNLMITGGASQALASVCFTFLDPGDVVITENPTFPLSLRTLRAHQAQLAGVPLDDEGPRLDALEVSLEEAQRQGRRVKLIYLTPNFQNPTGIAFSVERRRAVAELAARYRCLIVEDDAYGELRYDGAHRPSLFALAGGHGVVRLGSFSKTIGPGLRVGWTLASPAATQAMAALRLDMGGSPFLARLAAAFSEDGRYDRHLQRLVAFYRAKRDAMAEALAVHCGGWSSFRLPQGGFFIWLELEPGIDGEALAAAALEEGLTVAPGLRFFCYDPQRNYVRLAFSYVALDEIDEAARRLARAAARVRS